MKLNYALVVVISVVIASARQLHADNLVTGGGWINGLFAGHANFSVFAGVQNNGAFKGNVIFDDHSIDFRLESTEIINVDCISVACTCTIEGIARVNGIDGTPFSVTVTDNGEPGTVDTFSIVAVVYANANFLQGGNIQVHHESCR